MQIFCLKKYLFFLFMPLMHWYSICNKSIVIVIFIVFVIIVPLVEHHCFHCWTPLFPLLNLIVPIVEYHCSRCWNEIVFIVPSSGFVLGATRQVFSFISVHFRAFPFISVRFRAFPCVSCVFVHFRAFRAFPCVWIRTSLLLLSSSVTLPIHNRYITDT